MGNTYKFSTRDNYRYLTCNNELISQPWQPNWGFYGFFVLDTAYKVLLNEYGPATAERNQVALYRFLVGIEADDFILTSGEIEHIISQKDPND